METSTMPQGVPPDEPLYIGNLYTTPRTIADWRAKANAYPKLVQALRGCAVALAEPANQGNAAMRRLSAEAILREIGEL